MQFTICNRLLKFGKVMKMTKQAKLLPCPFCGGESKLDKTRHKDALKEGYEWVVRCTPCNNQTDIYMQYHQAIEKWISVKDRLPEDNQCYLTRELWNNGIDNRGYMRFDKDNQEFMAFGNFEITHWMPVPALEIAVGP